ncbi:hypothetical protein N9A12_02820 [Gammaproteobacteria bacterium]|nr:hypothetical protein [Gammaproteobacteria bacterium]
MKLNLVKKPTIAAFVTILFFCLYIDINLLAITLAYTTALTLLFLLGKKIPSAATYVLYSWSVKWALFIFFTAYAAINLTSIYFYSMMMFIGINIFLSPALEAKEV